MTLDLVEQRPDARHEIPGANVPRDDEEFGAEWALLVLQRALDPEAAGVA